MDMEEPAPKMLKLSKCLICNDDSQVTHFQARYTEFVMNWFISSPEKESFCSERYFDFCLRCIGLLEELQGLRQGLDFIYKNIKAKEGEIKRKIANSSQSSTDLDVKKFREFATKDLHTGFEVSEYENITEILPSVSPAQTAIKLEPTEDVEFDTNEPNESDFQSPTEFPLTYPNFSEVEENGEIISPDCKVDIECFQREEVVSPEGIGGVECDENEQVISADCKVDIECFQREDVVSPEGIGEVECDENEEVILSSDCKVDIECYETDPISMSNNDFDESKSNMSSIPVCKEEDLEMKSEDVEMQSSHIESYEEEEAVFPLGPWTRPKHEEDVVFEIIPPEITTAQAASDDEDNDNEDNDDDPDNLSDSNSVDSDDIEKAKAVKANAVNMKMKEIVAKIMKPKINTSKFWPRPSLEYPHLCILAIMTKDDMLLTLPEIFLFILDNFPYFKIRTNDWKDSIKDCLNLKYFSQYQLDLNKKGELPHPGKIINKYTVQDFQISSMILEMTSMMSFEEFSSYMAHTDRLKSFRSSLKRKIYPVYDSRYQLVNKTKTVSKSNLVVSKPTVPQKSTIVLRSTDASKMPKQSIIKKNKRSRKLDTVYPATPLSFKHLCIVAIMNSNCKLASAPDILNFILKNFPYYGTMEANKLLPYKRVLPAVLKQSQFTLHNYWREFDINASSCSSLFEDVESYKFIYTVDDESTSEDFRNLIAATIRSKKNLSAMKYPERAEDFAESVLEEDIVPNLTEYKKMFEKGRKKRGSLQ